VSAFPIGTSIPGTNCLHSPYSSKVVTIAIGPSKTPFSIHKGKLEETSFFEIHGGPVNTPSPQDAGTPSDVGSAGSDGIFVPQPGDGDGDTPMKAEENDMEANGGDGAGAMPNGKPADFAIIDRFHTVGAFKIVSSYTTRPPFTSPFMTP
jgi:hypothetical protein